MIRLGRYHLLAALGLVLAYNSLLGIFNALGPSLSLYPEPGEWSPPATPPAPTALIADPLQAEPPARLVAVPAQARQESAEDILSLPPADPASVQSPAPVTATPTSTPLARSLSKPLETSPTPASSPQGLIPVIPQEAESTPPAQGERPNRLVIPAIDLDAPIVPAKIRTVIFRGEPYQQWLAPNYHAAGWHTDSALLGVTGNTVLSGHHNALGAVFGRLIELEAGDIIRVYSQNSLFIFQVANRMIVPEKYQQLDTRMANVQWLFPSQDERLTLITCWPDESNTHRVIIVAAPVEHLNLSADFQ
jgi:sortase A